MKKGWQYVANVALYGFLLWLLYDSTLVEWDPWFAFVVVVALVASLIPAIHAPSVSPGSYPFDE